MDEKEISHCEAMSTPASGEQIEVVALPEGTISKCENDVTIAFKNDADAVTAFNTLEVFMFRPSKAARELCEELTAANERAERAERERDTEIAALQIRLRDWRNAHRLEMGGRAAAEALNTTLSEALAGLLEPFEDEPCRYDHHGCCQAHFVQSECCVANARTALAALPAKQGGQS